MKRSVLRWSLLSMFVALLVIAMLVAGPRKADSADTNNASPITVLSGTGGWSEPKLYYVNMPDGSKCAVLVTNRSDGGVALSCNWRAR